MTTITYEDFTKVDLRSGTIVQAESFPKARKPAYKVWVDFGKEIGVLQTSAQVTGCVSLGEKNIAGFVSQFLLVEFSDENGGICLATIDPRTSNGQKLH